VGLITFNIDWYVIDSPTVHRFRNEAAWVRAAAVA
jgi:hypothetical protein